MSKSPGSRLIALLRSGIFLGLGAGAMVGCLAGLYSDFAMASKDHAGIANGLVLGACFGVTAGAILDLLSLKPPVD